MNFLKEDHKEFIKSYKLILKTQQIISSKNPNILDFFKFKWWSNNEINLFERAVCILSKHLVCQKDKIQDNNIIEQYNTKKKQKKNTIQMCNFEILQRKT